MGYLTASNATHRHLLHALLTFRASFIAIVAIFGKEKYAEVVNCPGDARQEKKVLVALASRLLIILSFK